MTTDGGSAGTPARGYRVPDPPAIPRPRQSDDPTEPGRRRDTAALAAHPEWSDR